MVIFSMIEQCENTTILPVFDCWYEEVSSRYEGLRCQDANKLGSGH